MSEYQGYLIEEKEGAYAGSIQLINTPEIEDNHLIINVEYSSLNLSLIHI